MEEDISQRSPDPRPEVQQNPDEESNLLETPQLVISAAEAGNWDLICELLSNGHVGARDVKESFLLHRLASSQSVHPSRVLRVLKTASKRGVEYCLLDSNGDPAVVLAAKHENWDSVMAFLLIGISLPQDEVSLLSLVQMIALSQSLERMPYLLMDIVFALCRHVRKVNFSKEDGRVQNMLVQLAAKVNMWSRVCDLLVYKPDLNILDRDGLTVLHRLVMCPDSRFDCLLPVLLTNGADVNIKSSRGETPLHFAANCQKLAKTAGRTRRDECEQLKISDKEGSNAAARYTSKLQALTLLTEACANVDEFDGQRNTGVLLAAKNGNWEFVLLLLEHGGRGDILDDDQRSVLHVLAANGYFLDPDVCENVVTQVLKSGGLINGLDKDGHSALHLAFQYNTWTIARQLIRQEASAEIPDSEGYCALHRLALTDSKHQEEVISLFSTLRHAGANLNISCPAGNTVLHLAAGTGNWTVARHLVELGVSVNEYNHEGCNVLHVLVRTTPGFDRATFLDFLDVLIDNRGDVEFHTPDSESVLHLAARYKNYSIVEHLLEREAVSLRPMKKIALLVFEWFFQRLKPCVPAMNVRSPDRSSLMQMAAKDEHWEIVDQLLRHFGGNANEPDSEGVSILYRVAASTGNAFKEGQGCSFVRRVLTMSKSLDNVDLSFLVHVAARAGNIDFVDLNLDCVDDVNTADEEGFTILHRVAQCSSSTSVAIVRRLVDKGADVDRRCPDGDTALHLAAKSCNWLAVMCLLRYGASVTCSDSEGMHVLHRLLSQPYLWCAVSELGSKDTNPGNILAYLLARGVLINERDPDGNTPLHLAVRYKQWDMAIMLLMRGASFDERDASGYTVLHRFALVELLKTTGKDDGKNVCFVSKCVTRSANNMRHWYVRCKCLGKQMLSYLDVGNFTRSETLIHTLDPLGNTALLLAARHNNYNVVKLLLLKGSDPSARDDEGMTVVHRLATANWASNPGCGCRQPNLLRQLMEYFLSRGICVTSRDSEGNTPIQLAAKHGNMEMVERLLEVLVNFNETDSEGFSLLSRVAVTSDPRCDVIARRLVEKGADVNMNSLDGCSPLLLAVKARNWPVAIILWRKGGNLMCPLQEVTRIVDILIEDPCPNRGLFIQGVILTSLFEDDGIFVERRLDGESSMQRAIKARQWWIVKRFLLNGVYTDPEPLVGEFVFHELASFSLDVLTTDALLPLLPNPMLNINMRDASGDTPLNVLAKAGKWDLAKVFISLGADVNMADSKGWTTVHRLAMANEEDSFDFDPLKMLNTIRKNGGDVNKPGPYGRRPANIALQERHLKIFWRLLLMGDDFALNAEEKNMALKCISFFPRKCQAEEKIKVIVEYLTERSSDYGDAGAAKCLLAAEMGFRMCIKSSRWLVAKALLDCGNNFRLDGLINERPILHELVARYKKKDHTVWVAILDGLLARGVDINSRNKRGETVLMERSSLLSLLRGVGDPDSLFKVLVDRGADLLVVDSDGCSLLRYAIDFSGRTALRLVKCFVELGLANRQNTFTGVDDFDVLKYLRSLLFVVDSPGKAAIKERKARVLKVLIESGATSNSELFSIYRSRQIMVTQSSMMKEDAEILSLLKQSATQPRTLKSTCRLAVAGSIACGLDRKEKVMSLPLPPLLRDFVAFSDLLSHESSNEESSGEADSSDREDSSSEESFGEQEDETSTSDWDSESDVVFSQLK